MQFSDLQTSKDPAYKALRLNRYLNEEITEQHLVATKSDIKQSLEKASEVEV